VLDPQRPSSVGERSLDRLRRRIEGDLDAIILKALRKEPERRYASVAELSADVGRHLDGLPVLARPDSVGYRIGKLLRRRRIESVAAVVAVVAVVAGMIGVTVQGRAAVRERERATEVTDFVRTMLGPPIRARWAGTSAFARSWTRRPRVSGPWRTGPRWRPRFTRSSATPTWR
jgi:serine/threonine-protein kinase